MSMKLLKVLPDAYIVGGAVRDTIMGRNPKDIDIVTSMLPEDVLKNFNSYPLGQKFGTVVVRDGVREIEVTTMRKDITGGRHPAVEFTNNITEDLFRRDFRMNAMAMDWSGRIIDPFNGQHDIINKLISSVDNPYITFDPTYGDPLRALRAIRFSITLDFNIEQELQVAIMDSDLSTLSGERIYSELMQMFCEPEETMRALYFYNVLSKVLPEVDDLSWCVQSVQWHPEGDALEHTILVMERVKKHGSLAVMAAMLHDIGKPVTREGMTYHGHAKSGIEIAESIMKRFGRPKIEVEAIKFVVENHMKIKEIENMKASKRRKLYDSPHFDLLMLIARADNVDIHNDSMFKFIEQDNLVREIDIEPLLNGYDFMELGYSGIEIGLAQKELKELQLLELLIDKESAIKHFKYWFDVGEGKKIFYLNNILGGK